MPISAVSEKNGRSTVEVPDIVSTLELSHKKPRVVGPETEFLSQQQLEVNTRVFAVHSFTAARL